MDYIHPEVHFPTLFYTFSGLNVVYRVCIGHLLCIKGFEKL